MKTSIVGLLGCVLPLVTACSAADDGAKSGGGFGGSAAGGGGAGGSAGGGGSGGTAATGAGGTGGGLVVDSGSGATGGGTGADAACQATGATAQSQPVPADIIWAVDQSGSMDQEAQYVQQKINEFANAITTSGIDYRVVMIASTTSGEKICVPPPLAGPGCGNGPRFRLVDVKVDSEDALDRIVYEYPKYSDFLRPNSVKHFVVVTDDNARSPAQFTSAAAFTAALTGLQPPGMFAQWIFHGIYAFGVIPITGCLGVFGSGAMAGTVYAQLIQQTGGAQGQICSGDWTQVFQAIQQSVVESAVSCEYVIPPPPPGETLDANKVNVDYYPQGSGSPGSVQPVLRVSGIGDCKPGQGLWYYDDNAAPTRILLCPQTCDAVQSNPAAQIDVLFGCESVFAPPE
ncbi:MAG: hypothetical protein IT376_17195 [Polyangiaceae bacterium]|nr:hypothetical protein [Polyangiaceae bacterium]